MDVLKMLADLRQERAQIEEAIIVLERLALGHGKRRGRPPAWLKAAFAPVAAAPTRKRRRQSAAQRKAQAERMKAYWSAKRKTQAKK